MEWQDCGLVLSTRRHGERDAILEVISEAHGRHFGLVRSGRGPRHSATLQAGNRVSLIWRARLEEHLGAFSVEPLISRAAFIINNALALHAVAHLGVLVRLLPERQAHPHVYAAADALCALAGEPDHLAPMLVRFELLILSELGFGLDLSECAATGRRDDLIYVSPKSGRAVCRQAGAPWKDKLLPLPEFLKPEAELSHATITAQDIAAAYHLVGFFLERHVFDPRGLAKSQARATFLSHFLARELHRTPSVVTI